jgi:hypothetical protein
MPLLTVLRRRHGESSVGEPEVPVGPATTLPEGAATTLPEGAATTLPEGAATTLPEGPTTPMPEGPDAFEPDAGTSGSEEAAKLDWPLEPMLLFTAGSVGSTLPPHAASAGIAQTAQAAVSE